MRVGLPNLLYEGYHAPGRLYGQAKDIGRNTEVATASLEPFIRRNRCASLP